MPIIRSSRLYVLLPPMVCSAWLLVVGGQVQSSRVCVQEEGCCTSCRERNVIVIWSPLVSVLNSVTLLYICVEKKDQLDVTECFIALMISSTCFGHFYAHHQGL